MKDSVTAVFNYREPPYERLLRNENRDPRFRFNPERNTKQMGAYPMTVGNARGKSFSLQQNGFQFAQHQCKVANYFDDEEVRTRYYPQVAQFLEKELGATKVVTVSHVSRDESMTHSVKGNEVEVMGAHRFIHNDFTEIYKPVKPFVAYITADFQ
jgi:hypothetical protein